MKKHKRSANALCLYLVVIASSLLAGPVRAVEPNHKAQHSESSSSSTSTTTRSERMMITSQVGIDPSNVQAPVKEKWDQFKATNKYTTLNATGHKRRAREEIEDIFNKNKGAIYQLYSRALRDNKDLKGRIVFEITVLRSGEVVACRVISSLLSDWEFERKLVARIKLINFGAGDFETLTFTKPLEFFPATPQENKNFGPVPPAP